MQAALMGRHQPRSKVPARESCSLAAELQWRSPRLTAVVAEFSPESLLDRGQCRPQELPQVRALEQPAEPDCP